MARPSGRASFSLLAVLGFALLVLYFSSNPAAAQSQPSDYATELVERADAARLHEERYWHLLLHYRSTIRGIESEADEPGFFLAPNGRTDPKAELDATIAKLFSLEPVGRSQQPARCAFVARYTWLKDRLGIDENRLPRESCDRFNAWLAELNVASLTLIFPSAYMNNPSSMFGHLLLRADQRGQTEQTRILAYTINYSADVTTNNGFVFAVMGITGGFKGYFSTHPYYVKAREYGDFENRDIWEYRLNLDGDQIRRLLMHTWEMGNASFDYFFFKENCAYEILSLLEVADPGLHLTDRFWFYTFPTDAVRSITEQPGLVQETTFRPSRRTKIRRGYENLSRDEQSWLIKIIADPHAAEDDAFARMPAQRRAAVLDVGSDYFLYRLPTDPANSADYEKRNQAVLIARSKLKVGPPAVPMIPVTGPPEEGHKTMRAGLGAGWRNGEFFNELNFRLAFHDRLDPEYGYTPDAEIEALGFALRHYFGSGHTRLERVKLLGIESLAPVSALFKAPSWKFDTGLETIRLNGCRFCRIGHLNAGLGVSTETSWLRREVYFAFAEFTSEYGTVFEGNYRLGGGASIGALVDVTERWKLSVAATHLEFPAGQKSEDWRFTAQQRYTITRDVALRFDFNRRSGIRDYLLNLQLYF